MLNIRNIITDRHRNSFPPNQMYHEWENVLAQELNVGLKPMTGAAFVPDISYSDQDCDLVFIPLAQQLFAFRDNCRLVPIIVDLYQKDFELIRTYAPRYPLVYVTSLQVYREMCGMGLSNVRYIPFSVADRYLNWSRPPKDVDLIQFGRTNPMLDEFMRCFLQRHPGREYITSVPIDGKVFFHSNLNGVMYEAASRSIFMYTLARAKISLVSTPGMDNSRQTNGLDAASPRFYESMAARCHMVGRFPGYEELGLLGFRPFCLHVNQYEEFENTVMRLLENECNLEEYNLFLQGHVTSCRAKIIMRDCCLFDATN